jgi:hypothetical protein
MPGGNRRHTEFFGPDLARGPFSASQLDTAIVQIATALAQLRAPLLRSDDEIRSHADFIREVADKLAPDAAQFVSVSVGAEVGDLVSVSVRMAISGRSLLRVWLADSIGGGESGTAAGFFVWNSGAPLQIVTANKQYVALTDSAGVLNFTIGHSGSKTWFLGVARQGRAFYSAPIVFL